MTAATAVKCGGGCNRYLVGQRTPAPLPDGHCRNHGRGMCNTCRRHNADSLLDFPRSTVASDDTLDDWDRLRRQGLTREEAAPRIGVTVAALDKAIERGLDVDDPRAVWAPRSRHPNSVRAARQAVQERRRGWPRVLAV